jgi:hypothetical protein
VFLYIFVLYKLFYTLSNDTNCFFPNRIIVYSLTSYASLPLKPTIGLLSAMATIIVSLLVNSVSRKKGFLPTQRQTMHVTSLPCFYLMSFLQLEDHHVTTAHSTVTDTAMLRIENSSEPTANEQPINVNSFGRVNKKLCRFIIDYNSLQVVFNNWYPFSTQVAPAPYAKMTRANVMSAIKHNQMIFISLCLMFNNNLYSYFR